MIRAQRAPLATSGSRRRPARKSRSRAAVMPGRHGGQWRMRAGLMAVATAGGSRHGGAASAGGGAVRRERPWLLSENPGCRQRGARRRHDHHRARCLRGRSDDHQERISAGLRIGGNDHPRRRLGADDRCLRRVERAGRLDQRRDDHGRRGTAASPKAPPSSPATPVSGRQAAQMHWRSKTVTSLATARSSAAISRASSAGNSRT
jgi:hypothetical protein